MDNKDEVVEGLVKLSNMMINEIATIKAENSLLKNRINSMEMTIQEMILVQKNVIATMEKNQHEVMMLGQTMTRSVDNVLYEAGLGSIPSPKVCSVDETVNRIINEKVGISRFGDGEFSIMMGKSRQGFQRQDNRLAQRLREVIECTDNDFLIAIADNYGSLEKYCELSKNEIRFYMTNEVRRGHNHFFDMNRVYYNAYMTTPYFLYEDKNSDGPLNRFDLIKKIWENRDLIIVEGELSRLGVGNDLFAEAKSVKRILGPAEHAFDRYDELFNAAVNAGEKESNPLFLIALGPTATVLSYDLHRAGFQAIDIGHIDNDYEYFLRRSKEREVIPGKYVNNITKKEEVDTIYDAKYEASIIERLF